MNVLPRRRPPAAPGEPVPAPAGAVQPPDLLAKAAVLRRLELDVTRALDGLLSGDLPSRSICPGSEAADARPYGPGDDARRIDWSLTARSLVPHVRTTHADRELETWVVADCSASMNFGTAQREKREAALAALAAFGVLTVRGGNRLGLVLAGGSATRRLPARPGRQGLLTALSALYDAPRLDQPAGAGADLPATLNRLSHSTPRRGQVVVISDFLGAGVGAGGGVGAGVGAGAGAGVGADPPAWHAPLRRLALRHQCVAVHVSDPRELTLPSVGMVLVRDPESGRELHVQTSDVRVRARFSEAAAARHSAVRSWVERSGAAYLHLSTDRDWLREVLRFAARDRGRGSGAVRAWPVAAGGGR